MQSGIETPLEGALLKLKWAFEKIKQIKSLEDDFARNPCTVVSEKQPDGTTKITISIRQQIPEAIIMLTSEALHHLRSSLDYLAGLLAVQNGGSAQDANFVICESSSDYPRNSKRSLAKFTAQGASFIRDQKPYKDGDKLLWILSNANNWDKHEALLVLRPYIEMLQYTFSESADDPSRDACFGNSLSSPPPLSNEWNIIVGRGRNPSAFSAFAKIVFDSRVELGGSPSEGLRLLAENVQRILGDAGELFQ